MRQTKYGRDSKLDPTYVRDSTLYRLCIDVILNETLRMGVFLHETD
jgi:hypothetical protein